MSTLSSTPMTLARVDFDELYARHLCRHSQFGINVIHLLALFGVWFGVYSSIYWLFPNQWVPIAMAGLYLATVAINAPIRTSAATALFLAVFVATVLAVPMLAVHWGVELPAAVLAVYLLMIPVFYKLQAWSHRWYSVESDMTEFNKKYTKGSVLFVILLIYEVPMLLNYLLFDRKSWRA